MSEFIGEMFKKIFGDNVVLATVIISMMPIIELRGGIPFGMAKKFWGNAVLSSWGSFGWSLLGSCLVVPILALLFLPIINWLKKTKVFKKFATKVEQMIQKKSSKIAKTENESTTANEVNVDNELKTDKKGLRFSKRIKYNKQFFLKLVGVFAFVAVPLPLTGVWTGTAIAVMLGLGFFWSCITVILGNCVAGVIMVTLCKMFPNFTNIILYVFLGITAILILFAIIKNKIKAKNVSKDSKTIENK